MTSLSDCPHHPFAERPWRLLALDTAVASGSTRQRLPTDPCPVIGIGPEDHPCAIACDVVVASEADAAPLIAQIEQHPIAAMVLVQLLRMSERLDLHAGLIAESLAYATLQAGVEHRRWLAAHATYPPAPAASEPAVLMRRDGDTLRLTLNRPTQRNAMSVEMRDALIEALDLVLADEQIRSVTLDAAGDCFSTGGELREFGTTPDVATAHAVRSLALPGRQLAACAERVRVIVHGACIGSGIEFPAFAGQVHARSNAWFQLPELAMGLIPGAGGCISISRRIGRQRTAWWVLSGRRIRATTALEWGLVDALVS